MRITINGNVYDLRFANSGIPSSDDGFCEAPSASPSIPKIRIRPNLSRERTRECLIHELLHAARWSMSEDSVTRIASDIADTLNRLGY